MDMQMVSTTYLQRNIGKIFDSIKEGKSIIVTRDSLPVAVFIKYEEYMEYVKHKKKTKAEKLISILEKSRKKSRDIDEAIEFVKENTNIF